MICVKGKMEPIISVIMPVYDSEKYLSDCLESILAQTYSNIQIIAIDDGSTDKSGKILDQYAAKDNRIEVYHQQNLGVSAARNRGLKYARGEYITFVDSDDTLSADMYEILISQFNEKDLDIVHCGYKKKRLDGTSKSVLGTNRRFLFNRIEGMQHFIRGDLFTGALWNKLYKRSVLQNLFFDENLKINEDVLFNFYAFNKASNTLLIDKPLYNYYEREVASTKRTTTLKKIFDCTEVAKAMYEESLGEPFEVDARTRYIRELINKYRGIIYSDIKQTTSERKIIENTLIQLLKEENEVARKYIYNFRMMTISPRIYKLLYSIYDKIRKPNWDIGN